MLGQRLILREKRRIHRKPRDVCATREPYDVRGRFFSDIHLCTAYKAPPQQNTAIDQNSHRSL